MTRSSNLKNPAALLRWFARQGHILTRDGAGGWKAVGYYPHFTVWGKTPLSTLKRAAKGWKPPPRLKP